MSLQLESLTSKELTAMWWEQKDALRIIEAELESRWLKHKNQRSEERSQDESGAETVGPK